MTKEEIKNTAKKQSEDLKFILESDARFYYESFICGAEWYKEYADQQTKPLIDEIAELKLDNSNLEARVRSWGKMYKTLLQENLKLKSRIDELQREIDINKNPF